MIRVNMIVEGQTEETFVNQVLAPYLAEKNILMAVRCISNKRTNKRKHRGGMSTYAKVKQDLQFWIREGQDAWYTCSQYDSPEYINDGPETAPSKRIIQVISDYKNRKATAGPAIALEIGIPQMKEKCSHFANWLERLESLR